MRGKVKCPLVRAYSILGSPPPMRGKVIPPLITTVLPRITPAYAGKSGGVKKPWRLNEDHPRLCGEKL